jgi:hypothetical protein
MALRTLTDKRYDRGTRYRGSLLSRCTYKAEGDLKIMGIRLAYSGQRLEGMEEDCIGSEGSQCVVVLEDNNDDMLRHDMTFVVCCREWGSLKILDTKFFNIHDHAGGSLSERNLQDWSHFVCPYTDNMPTYVCSVAH